MTNFIPIFPLAMVVFPDELLQLHIFEPRYKQLITECFESKKPFGIPSVINSKISEMGTLVDIISIQKHYENGEMDILVKGVDIFRILEVVEELPEKLYSGAIVNYPENRRLGKREMMEKILEGIRTLHDGLNIRKDFLKKDHELWSYDVAHFAGLSLHEEYDFLCLLHELQREEYLKQHLLKVIRAIAEKKSDKEHIKLKDHFKHLPGFSLN